MKLKQILVTSASGIAAVALMPSTAAAQSTGSIEFETENEIIVTGTINRAVGGVEIPDTPKAKQVLNEEIIRRQRPGQTVNDIVNLVPGVSFQNNDPWGSSGGSFTIRGFSSDRISQTLDGLPLNDSGNYALYTNQQVDPEVLEQVNVNLGVTDIDSPTASAVGGTINIRTREPGDEIGVVATATYGDILARDKPNSRAYTRGFVMFDTGDLTGNGLKAFVSASLLRYDNPFNNYGKVTKQQYNARVWQDLGDNGDFIAISGHYNQNRNNFFGSDRISSLPTDSAGRFYNINFPCTVDSRVLGGPDQAGGSPGASVDYDDRNGCGAEFDRRYNPSNTGNIRIASRFTLSDQLTLTVDPSYQYVKANGGGVDDLRETFFTANGNQITGFINGGYYYGRDLNGDGDLDDEIAGIDPSQTRTHRFGVIANLIFELNPDNIFRLAYTHDNADHRQTGTTGYLLSNGEPADVFAINDPILSSTGYAVGKRDRQSYAILNQISGEYRGRFGGLTVFVGGRVPFFERELDQRCFTTEFRGETSVSCVAPAGQADFAAANPYTFNPANNDVTGAAPPQQRTYKYSKFLPNVGLTYEFGDFSVFGNYAQGLSVPGTESLYDSLYFPVEANAQPDSETTDSFDAGVRFQTGAIQAQVALWYTKYENRRAFAYDPVLDLTVERNLGPVDKYGIDASIAWRPTPDALIYVFGSLNESEIKNDLQADGTVFQTAGKREAGAPTNSFGGRLQYRFGPVEAGIQAKHTGKRYVNDQNLPVLFRGNQVYGATAPSYTLVDIDVRVNLGESPLGGDFAVQLNMTNVFDEVYVGGFGGNLDNEQTPFAQRGAPRAGSISLIMGF
ncbi:TonB-dependent receptor [Paraurantiacibacter namhicola]|uniref:Vitamin B12/cobalamin outer membrane transporter n=1 Tax=Paraurantiacibacter namhicola TaxID=645517 RepID=A0A1C7DAC0_9SPHN|nr:TonB-dependent receptor [Paraurantiacibacter namhicola]ANU08404.1 vitamin B12/cobalamin outer membrane transporter [Paraurantiacibacter namhicola]